VGVGGLNASIRTLGAEYEADLAFRLIDANQLMPDAALALLTHVFNRSAEVKEALPNNPVPVLGTAKSRRAIFANAFVKTQLTDRLTVRLRVIDRLLARNRVLATKLMAGLMPDVPEPPTSPCEILPVTGVGSFYSVGYDVVGGFAPFLSERLQTLPAVAALLRQLSGHVTLSPSDVQTIGGWVGKAFGKIRASDRDFTVAELYLHLTENLGEFLGRLPRSSDLRSLIAVNYKDFMMRQLRGARCRDTLDGTTVRSMDRSRKANQTFGGTPEIVDRYNAFAMVNRVQTVNLSKLVPASVLSPPSPTPETDSGFTAAYKRALGLTQEYFILGTSSARRELATALDMLRPQPIEHCPDCTFVRLIDPVFELLMITAPLGNDPINSALIDRLAVGLEASDLRTAHPAIWMFECKRVVNLTHFHDKAFAQLVVDRLSGSRIPELRVYCQFEQVIAPNGMYINPLDPPGYMEFASKF
jgi:hypothetical protein